MTKISLKIAALAMLAAALSGCIVISTTKSEKPAVTHAKPAAHGPVA